MNSYFEVYLLIFQPKLVREHPSYLKPVNTISSLSIMKIIVAGLPKTGTKTMNEALRILGYSVYDYVENFYFLYDEWMKVFREGGKPEDFRQMFKDVDVIVDEPGCHFWQEIHAAFPEAKVII